MLHQHLKLLMQQVRGIHYLLEVQATQRLPRVLHIQPQLDTLYPLQVLDTPLLPRRPLMRRVPDLLGMLLPHPRRLTAQAPIIHFLLEAQVMRLRHHRQLMRLVQTILYQLGVLDTQLPQPEQLIQHLQLGRIFLEVQLKPQKLLKTLPILMLLLIEYYFLLLELIQQKLEL